MKMIPLLQRAAAAALLLAAGTALAHPGHDGAAHPAHLWPLLAVAAVLALGLSGATVRGRIRPGPKALVLSVSAAAAVAALLMLSHR
jgi:hypothetical protein